MNIDILGLSKEAKSVLDSVEKYANYYSAAKGEKPEKVTLSKKDYSKITKSLKSNKRQIPANIYHDDIELISK